MPAPATGRWLCCPRCGSERVPEPLWHGCPNCASRGVISPLEVRYAYEQLKETNLAALFRAGPRSMWRFHPLLPLDTDQHTPISFGEGGTPLIPAPTLAQAAGVSHLYLKLEGCNPTGSFKDRLNSVAVSVGRTFGLNKLVGFTSGNHGVAIAAYGRAAGMRTLVLCPPEAELRALQEIRFFGAEVVVCSGDVLGLQDELITRSGWFTSARNFPRPFANPYGIEGYKTIAFEIAETLDYQAPAAVFVPTGGGDSIYGMWKGFWELYQLGLLDHLPRMFACQPAAAASVVRAWRDGLDHVEAVSTHPTIAASIVAGRSGDHALWAVRASDGGCIDVSDEEIVHALHLLGQAGACAEPASAAAVAGLLKARTAGLVSPEGPAVCVLTATGTRWSTTFSHLPSAAPQIQAKLAELAEVTDL